MCAQRRAMQATSWSASAPPRQRPFANSAHLENTNQKIRYNLRTSCAGRAVVRRSLRTHLTWMAHEYVLRRESLVWPGSPVRLRRNISLFSVREKDSRLTGVLTCLAPLLSSFTPEAKKTSSLTHGPHGAVCLCVCYLL